MKDNDFSNLSSVRTSPSDATDASDEGGLKLVLAVLVAVVILVGADLVLDSRSGARPLHLVFEGTLMLTAGSGALHLFLRMRRARSEALLLARDVNTARAEARRWRHEARELLEGLGLSMGRQFDRWQLTPAERDVALLLLKGLSHREAAQVRETSERTVRQQAREVYRKAGLSGRSELAAFFLEDLLVPPERAQRPEAPESDTESGSE